MVLYVHIDSKSSGLFSRDGGKGGGGTLRASLSRRAPSSIIGGSCHVLVATKILGCRKPVLGHGLGRGRSPGAVCYRRLKQAPGNMIFRWHDPVFVTDRGQS